jgi:hypothetical protein
MADEHENWMGLRRIDRFRRKFFARAYFARALRRNFFMDDFRVDVRSSTQGVRVRSSVVRGCDLDRARFRTRNAQKPCLEIANNGGL